MSSPKPALRLMSSADRIAPRYPVAGTGAARRFLRERVYPAFRVPALLAYRMRLRFLKLLPRARRFNATLAQGEGVPFAALAQRESRSSFFNRAAGVKKVFHFGLRVCGIGSGLSR